MNKKYVKILLGVLLLCFTAAAIRFPLADVEAASASFADFQMKGDTLVKYTGTASAVSIPTSVKHIGKEAFAGHTELVKVTIPGYIESIDYNAFHGCTSLETISIPDTVTSIGNGAFSGCSSLKSMKLGKKLEKLGSGVFAGCSSLSSMQIDKNNADFVYEDGIIYSKDKKILYNMIPGYAGGDYRMPSTVEEIKSYAFWGCQSLRRVYFGSNVEKIPDYAFENCTGLEKVSFPYSLRRIGMKSFAGCTSLGDTEIPMSVSQIHDTAFDGCRKLTIYAEEGSNAAAFEAKRDKSNAASAEYQDIVTVAEETDTDNDNDNGESAQDSQTGQSGQNGQPNQASNGNVLGQSMVVGGNAVVFMDNSQSRVVSGSGQAGAAQPESIQSGNIQSYPDSGSEAMEVIGGNGQGALPKFTIVNNEKIASQAYYRNTELQNYRIPDGIKEIGEFAFARSALTSIMIPEGVTTIGYGAFYHCDNLAEISIPSSVTEIEPSAFAETAWIKEQAGNRDNPFVIVGDGILLTYGGMGSQIEIPRGVKQIGAEAFKGNTQITGITLPDSVSIIGEDAFAGCSNLVSISGGNSLTEIRDRAFEGCPISTIKIPASVKEIGLKAYDMTNSGKQDIAKTAVILGNQLPAISCEKTATRLVNEEYRDAVFKDVRIAVVDESITEEDIKGSVLDPGAGGFRGLVCTVDKAASGDTPGILKIQFCMLPKSEVNSRSMPDAAIVYGKTYKLTGQGDMEYLSASQEKTAGENGRVTVEADCASWPSGAAASAELSGSQGSYILRIADSSTDVSVINNAYRRAAGRSGLSNLQVYDITLYDAATMTPITKLGRQEMTVTVPKPAGVSDENIHVVCLDEDGQLEQVSARIVTVDGQTCVRFQAKHFSVYGIGN